MKRTFALKVILTVVTDYAFVDRGYLQEFLEFVTNTEGGGLEASPHGLIYAADIVAPILRGQLEFLNTLDIASLNAETKDAWVQQVIADHGEFHLVEQMATPLFSSPLNAMLKAVFIFTSD